MDIDLYAVRRATSDDLQAIERLLDDADRVVLYADRSTVRRALDKHAFYLVETRGELVCVCGLFVAPASVAQIRVFGLLEGWPLDEVMRAALLVARDQLGAHDVTTLAFIGIEAWLVDGLAANDFRHANTIVTMQKTDFYVPDEGNPAVAIRPAKRKDYPAIMSIDRAVFVPLWHNTEETLLEYEADYPYFGVAELDGILVGYQCLSLIGRHGHVTRIAIHPDHQGQRIAVRMLAAAIHFFHKHRVFGITLNTQQDNHRARRLYEWFGFSVLGKEAQVMVCDLPCLSSQSQV
jgi:ribosomal protein S18 acetylase RimI-like enzyme